MLIEVSVKQGPRSDVTDCSLTEPVDELGIAKSTCREIIHLTQENIVKQFVPDEPTEIAEATKSK